MIGVDAATVQLWLAILAAAVGLVTLAKAVAEYRRQGTTKRIEFFLAARRQLKDNDDFQEIVLLLESDDEKLRTISMETKIEYVGFFEELALLVNSRVIRPEVAQYMFGYYALKCWDSKNFWLLDQRPGQPLDKFKEPYWAVFREFVGQMRPLQERLTSGQFAAKNYKL